MKRLLVFLMIGILSIGTLACRDGKVIITVGGKPFKI